MRLFKINFTFHFFCLEAFQATISKLGGVDIVVNTATVMNDRLWELEVDVNLVSVIFTIGVEEGVTLLIVLNMLGIP